MRGLLSHLVFALAVVVWIPAAHAQDQPAPLGTTMPLADVAFPLANGTSSTLAALQGSNGTVLIFWSNKCPWVDRYEGRLQELARTYGGEGFSFVLVNANDAAAFPDEGAAASASVAERMGDSVYMLDADGRLARALGASRTPHVFVFDGDAVLVYEGSIDDSPGDPGNVTQRYLDQALTAVAAGNPVGVGKTKAFGCTLKPKQ